MSEVNTSETPVSSEVSEGASLNQPSSAPDQEQKSRDYESEIQDLKNRNEGLSRNLGALTTRFKQIEKQLGVVEAPVQKVSDPAITSERTELENLKRELHQEKILNSLESELLNNGVPNNQVERFARLVSMDLGDKISVEGRRVSVDDNGVQANVGDFVSAYLKTSNGSWMLPPRVASKTDLHSNVDSTPKAEITRAQLGMMSPEELKKGNFKIID